MPPDNAGFVWKDAKRIFADALERDPGTRAEYIARMCGEDVELYREVVSLLKNCDRTDLFLERSPAGPIAVPADPLLRKRVGFYRILRQIGMGGMGTVYLAERADEEFRKRVALKAVRPELFNEQALRRFQNERQTLAVLDHPNIIRLLDGGTTEEGVPYLVTEYVEGQPLDRYCATSGIGVREKLELFRTVLSAVHFAHQNLIVHRDIKPANILVTPEGVPKLLDFGIAKLLRPEYSTQTMGLTRTDMQPMTPNFASPEQILGLPITTASDTYSLGVILYHLLTGHHPYELQMHTPLALGHAICETDPEKPSKFVERAEPAARSNAKVLRGDLDTIVLMAMRKEPQRRYASVEHFSEDIRRYLGGFPVLARKAGPWYQVSKFVGRNRASSAGVTLLTAGLILSAGVALQQKRAAERRFSDLRQFANFVLNDLDDKLIEGTTPARELLAKKGLEYLDSLAREKGGDPGIQRDLVQGYIRNGDVKGNLYGASLGETEGAEESYRKALGIAAELVRANGSTIEDRRTLVSVHLKLGQVLAASGNRGEAMKHYDEAFHINDATKDSATPDFDTLRQDEELWSDIGSARSLLSDPGGALESYRRALQKAERLPAAPHPKTRAHDIAYENEMVAYYSALTGDTIGAEETIGRSIAAYEKLAGANPSPEFRRLLAQAHKNLAEVQQLTGKTTEALKNLGVSLDMTEALRSEDPENKQNQIDLDQGLLKEIELLHASQQVQSERTVTLRALQIMKLRAEDPGAPFQHAEDYAQLLATTPFEDLRDDPAALRYARKAVTMTHETDPDSLRVLALAYDRNGMQQKGVETAKKALSLLAPGPSGFRKTLEADVSRLSR